MMKKLLFINACIRENSRTEALAGRYLEKMKQEYQDYQTEEIKISGLDIKPFDNAALNRRNSDTAQGRLDCDSYRLAHQFAGADCIVIAAPYWDCLFPAALKIYLEHICVAGITFAYGENGSLVKTCRADRMIYITTCGGYLPEHSAVETLIRELGKLFSIDDVRFYAAEGMDVRPDKAQEIMNEILDSAFR